MAGHNKWSKIKHKKAVEDSKKSKVFSNYSQAIALEAKRAQGNKNDPGLKAVIDRARAANMPMTNIDRAIAKGTNAQSSELEEVTYEGYGPGGVALMIISITDNRNRTTPEIKHLLNKNGGSLGEPGSTAWAFTKTDGVSEPITTIPLNDADQEKLADLKEKLEDHPDVNEVITNTS